MRSIRGIFSVLFFASWGAGLLAAVPITTSPIRLSIDLPAQNIDFSDLDARDANNRPIASPRVIRRFEDVLNQSLNQLLIENLTPAHRAWMQMLIHPVDAFGDWIGRARAAAQRWFWTVTGRGVRLAMPPPATVNLPEPAANMSATYASTNQFPSIAFLLISSTRLLC